MSGIFAERDRHEQVVLAADDASGLRCVIAITPRPSGRPSVVQIYDEMSRGGYQEDRARAKAERIATWVHEVFDRPERDGSDTLTAADRVAEARIAAKSGPNPCRLP